jgi:AraC family transcriptional regulator
MNPVEKSLWFIENRLSGEISLQEIARSAGVSSHYLARAFGAATGRSLMRYARGRRLSEAAKKLAAGAPDILTVALDAGYGSHEAFSRAFREYFGMPPDALRAEGSVATLKLMEPIRMDKTLLTNLAPPRITLSEELLIAGISARYTFETNEAIPSQWQRLEPHLGHVPGQVGPETYGLSADFRSDGSFEYVTGVRVIGFSELPNGFTAYRLLPRKYAVFSHRGHVSELRRTHYTIWNKWLPDSHMAFADAPNFELYQKEFDPRTGEGPIDIWMPIKE